MHDAISIILASRARLTVALALVAAVIAGGVTFGSWAVGSDPGNGYAKAKSSAKATSSQNLTLSDASGATVAQLYPGGNGDVKVKITNPNLFAVTVTSVKGAGAITSDKGAACDASTGVTYTDQSSLSLGLAAGATSTFTLVGAAHMSNASDTSCQGAVFTIPVTLTATS
jgi:hypothetical protein